MNVHDTHVLLDQLNQFYNVLFLKSTLNPPLWLDDDNLDVLDQMFPNPTLKSFEHNTEDLIQITALTGSHDHIRCQNACFFFWTTRFSVCDEIRKQKSDRSTSEPLGTRWPFHPESSDPRMFQHIWSEPLMKQSSGPARVGAGTQRNLSKTGGRSVCPNVT